MAVSIEINGSAVSEVKVPLGVAVTLDNADNTGLATLGWEIVSYPERYSETDPEAAPTQPAFATNYAAWSVGLDSILSIDQTSGGGFTTVQFTPDLPGRYVVRLSSNADADPVTAVIEVEGPQDDREAPSAGENSETGTFRGWARNMNRRIEMDRVRRGWERVYNGTGSTLTAGKVVRITNSPDWRTLAGNAVPGGAATARKRIAQVAILDGTAEASKTFKSGIVKANIAPGDFGWIQCDGIYEGNFGAYSTDSKVYVNATGDLTATETLVCIGVVTVANATGAMFVQPFRGSVLKSGHIGVGSSLGLMTGSDALRFDGSLLTVDGNTGANTAGLVLGNGQSNAVSPAGKGALRYNHSATRFEASVDGGAWAALTGTFGGTIAANQVAFGSGANTIAGNASLTWDNTFKKFAIDSSHTIASSGGLAWDALGLGGTLTLTGTTTVTALSLARLSAPTITGASAVTVTDAATLTIAGAPVAGGSATLTNPWSLRVVGGKSYFGGQVVFADGTNAEPSWTFAGDTGRNTGGYLITNDRLGFVSNGALSFEVYQYGLQSYALHYFANGTSAASPSISWVTYGPNTRGGFYFDTGGKVKVSASSSSTSGVEHGTLADGLGNFVWGTAALATSATDGFLYITTVPGTPTGAATSYTGRSPLVIDSTNSLLYFRNGGAWVSAGGGFSYTTISPSQITANQNDYAPTGWSTSTHVRLDSNASRNVTGFTATSTIVHKRIINVGSNDIVLKHQDASSSAANRLLCYTGADITLQADDSVEVYYDATTARWRVL